jgi:hypothetical protein
MAGYFMAGIPTQTYQVLVPFGEPTQPEESDFNRKAVKYVKHHFKVSFDPGFERRPLLNSRDCRAVQYVKPILNINGQTR